MQLMFVVIFCFCDRGCGSYFGLAIDMRIHVFVFIMFVSGLLLSCVCYVSSLPIFLWTLSNGPIGPASDEPFLSVPWAPWAHEAILGSVVRLAFWLRQPRTQISPRSPMKPRAPMGSRTPKKGAPSDFGPMSPFEGAKGQTGKERT